ncbi:MAG: hypothetical protein M0Z46_01465 [Actinomycetota bacterium]|jgi:hypothetical protein|nr:hypothetical protein [Actinomycetota bacterium]
MGLLDKVKTQAASATSVARDAAQKGQAKLDAIQAKRAADVLLRDLGAIVYAQRTGRSTATAESDIERIVTSLQSHEAEHGPINLGSESPEG